jgi:hypothetical protein
MLHAQADVALEPREGNGGGLLSFNPMGVPTTTAGVEMKSLLVIVLRTETLRQSDGDDVSSACIVEGCLCVATGLAGDPQPVHPTI